MLAKWLIACVGLLAASVIAPIAGAQTVTLKRGQSVELHAVYWIRNCSSTLADFEGIKVTSGPPGFSLSLKKQDVQTVRQQCGKPVPGAMVVLTAGPDAPLGTTTLRYQVNYLTSLGAHEVSTHTRDVTVVP